MKKCFGVALCLVMLGNGVVFAGGDGTSGAPFLKIGVGARAAGMGEAFCGLSDDINAIYWNPAGMANIQGQQFQLMHLAWFQSINYEHLAYAKEISGIGVIGGAVSMVNVKDMDEWVDNSGVAEYKGNFNASDMALSLSYSRELRGIMIGGNLKHISQTIKDKKASTLGLDLGVLSKTPIDGLTVGGTIQNLGGELKFISKSDPLPLIIKAGVAYRLPANEDIVIVSDLSLPNDNDLSVRAGVEWGIEVGNSKLLLRGGYKSGVDLGEFTAGLGFVNGGMCLDYAFVPYDDLDDTHRVSLMMKF